MNWTFGLHDPIFMDLLFIWAIRIDNAQKNCSEDPSLKFLK